MSQWLCCYGMRLFGVLLSNRLVIIMQYGYVFTKKCADKYYFKVLIAWSLRDVPLKLGSHEQQITKIDIFYTTKG